MRDMWIKRILIVFIVVVTLIAPIANAGIEWGGQVQRVHACWNNVIFTTVGPPIGGNYMWAPGVTRTYGNGAPSHPGQWLMGLYGAPYFCIVTQIPLMTWPGTLMTLMGSSR